MVTLEVMSKAHETTIYIQSMKPLDGLYDCVTDHRYDVTLGDWTVVSGRLRPTLDPPVKLVPPTPVQYKEPDNVQANETQVPTPELSIDSRGQASERLRTKAIPEAGSNNAPTRTDDDDIPASDPYAQLTIRVQSYVHQNGRA